jgi:hypothetical protein
MNNSLYTPSTAPRNGRVPGSRNKLRNDSIKLLLTLAKEMQQKLNQFGGADLDQLRIENLAKYFDVVIRLGELGLLDSRNEAGGSFINISINRFFPDKEPTITIEGTPDGQPPA